MNMFIERIEQFKWLIIMSIVALTVFFSYKAKDLLINANIISFLPDNEPIAQLYKEIDTQFGRNDMGMTVQEANDIFKVNVLQHLKQTTKSINYTNSVSTVSNLTIFK